MKERVNPRFHQHPLRSTRRASPRLNSDWLAFHYNRVPPNLCRYCHSNATASRDIIRMWYKRYNKGGHRADYTPAARWTRGPWRCSLPGFKNVRFEFCERDALLGVRVCLKDSLSPICSFCRLFQDKALFSTLLCLYGSWWCFRRVYSLK